MFQALRDRSSSLEGTSSRSLPNHGAWTCGEIVVNSSVSRQVYWIYKHRVPKGKKRSFSTRLLETLKGQLRAEGILVFEQLAKDYFFDNIVILHVHRHDLCTNCSCNPDLANAEFFWPTQAQYDSLR
jgi:hypothetical protein